MTAQAEHIQTYNHIRAKLREAQNQGNKRQQKFWHNKLNKWQQDYGAYAPIKSAKE